MAKTKWTVEHFTDLSACWMEIGDDVASASVEQTGPTKRYRAFLDVAWDPEDPAAGTRDVNLGEDFRTPAEAQAVAHDALCSWLVGTGRLSKARRLDPSLPPGVMSELPDDTRPRCCPEEAIFADPPAVWTYDGPPLEVEI